MLFDKIDGMNGDGIGNVLIFPKCLSTPFHKSDAADAIDDGHVMSVAGDVGLYSSSGLSFPVGSPGKFLV